MIRLVTGLLVAAFLCPGSSAGLPLKSETFNPETLYINYADTPDLSGLDVYDICILSPEAKIDLKSWKKQREGQRILAYISLVEVARDAPYRQEVVDAKFSFSGFNPEWNADIVDVSDPEWHAFVLNRLARRAAEKGYDGFFLDTAESIEIAIEKNPERTEAFVNGEVTLIRKLRAAYPDKELILNRGFRALPQVVKAIDGVLVEDLFQGYDFAKKKYKTVSEDDYAWIMEHLMPAREADLPVYIVDFVSPSNLELARQTAKKISALGFHPLVTTPDLMGTILAPVRQEAGRVLVLWGKVGSRDRQGRLFWPADSWTARFIQTQLEWLGYEVEYHQAADAPPPSRLPGTYQAIVLDAYSEFEPEREEAYVRWLLSEMKNGKKLLFCGSIPFREAGARRLLAEGLGIQLDEAGKARLGQVTKIVESDTRMLEFETTDAIRKHIRSGQFEYEEIHVPENASIALAVDVKPVQGGESFRSDSIFTTVWGGMALDPFVLYPRADHLHFWIPNPFVFLQRALEIQPRPVPDPTTAAGLRALTIHIDGDGFSSLSEFAPGKYCAEVIRDEILVKYPLPITSSVIESEIRGRLSYQKEGDAEKMTHIARAIFALPNTQVASHTYTHPFFWMEEDQDTSDYETPFLELLPKFQPEPLDYRREIEGSVRFINEQLAPPEKKTEVLLWSGNCRPGPDAIRIVDSLGVENVNGGDTMTTRRRSSLTTVAPRIALWEGELQIHCPVQNEMLYTNNFAGPFYGGYAKVIQTFERTGSPRRLKPVGIYFHMFCGGKKEAIVSLKKVFDWTMKQPLHSLTLAEYARSIRDTRNTRIYRIGPNRWQLFNSGHLRTFRIDDVQTVPDMNASRGILGYRRENNSLYLYTDNSGHTDLTLTSTPTPHLFLVSSTGKIAFQTLKPHEAVFTVEDYRPVTVVMGGVPPRHAVTLSTENTPGKSQELHADAQGQMVLQLSNRTKARIEVRP